MLDKHSMTQPIAADTMTSPDATPSSCYGDSAGQLSVVRPLHAHRLDSQRPAHANPIRSPLGFPDTTIHIPRNLNTPPRPLKPIRYGCG